MARRKTEEYTFADAYVGSFLRHIMSRQDLIRLASCKDLEGTESILAEFGYDDTRALLAGDVEGFINKEKQKLVTLVYSSIPNREELEFYLYPYDYHNIKVCLKSEFLGIMPDEAYMAAIGCIEPKQMAARVRDRSYMFMPAAMKEAISEATDLFGRGADPQEIDLILDKACYKDMLAAAERTGEEFLIGMVKLQIDVLNLKTFTRLREMNKPWSFFQKVFLGGGNIAEQFFISGYEEPYAQLADRLAPYGLKNPMGEGGRVLKESGDFNVLEKLCEDALMEYNKKAKYLSFGLAPIAGFWHAKGVEIDNLRIILTGISIGLSAEQMGERLREAYV